MAASIDRLLAAIAVYQRGVLQAVAQLKIQSLTDLLIYVVAPVVAILISAVLGSTDAIVTSVGLGTVNAGQAGARGQLALATYFQKSGKLQNSVISFNTRIAACDPADATELQKIHDDLLEAAAALANP